MLSKTLSESLQPRSSQADCISFCSGDESWRLDQASPASLLPNTRRFLVKRKKQTVEEDLTSMR